MRRALVLAALTVVIGAGVAGLADATQSRADPVTSGGTHVMLSVRTRSGIDTDTAVASLWAACQHTTRRTRLVAISPNGQGRYRLELTPSVGEHGRRRLVGCLQDATLDRVVATVEAFGPRTAAGTR